MKLKDILAISGQPGLYKFVAQSKNGIIVESLADGRRSNASSSAKVSALGEISVYTDGDEVSLASILTSMYEKFNGAQAISHKSSSDQLKAMFAEVLPDYDRDRVHVSDMKKIASWYNILVGAGMTDFTIEEPAEEEADQAVEEEQTAAE